MSSEKQPSISTEEVKEPISSNLSTYLTTANIIRKNLLRIYRRQKWQISHLVLFPIFFLYEEILLRLYGSNTFFPNLIYPILFSLSYGLLCTALTSAFKPKVNRIISMVILYSTGLLFIVECLVRDSYQVYMTIGAISSGAGGVATGFAGELFSAIFHGIPKIFMFFLPALFYTLTGRRRIPAKRYQIPFVTMILLCAFIFTGFSVLVTSLGKNGDKYTTQFDFNSGTQTFGLLTSVRLSATKSSSGSTNFLIEEDPAEEDSTLEESIVEEVIDVKHYGVNAMDIDFASMAESTSDSSISSLHSYVSGLLASSENEYTGLFEGKNLILICAEAFSDAVINEKLTPTLYRMVHNGFYFSDYYQPTWGGSTSSGEFSFVTGLAPVNSVQSMQDIQDNNNYFTLGNQLQRLGYYSCAYHNGEYDYYDRYLTHENLGYSQFLGLGNGLEDISDWWPDDETMFSTTLDTYIDQQPFSIYYMTISGHCTYRSDQESVPEHLEDVLNVYGSRFKDTTNYYMCYQMELEDALTTMIEKLEAAGILDDTVICLTSDHYPYGLENTATFDNTEDYVTDLYGYQYSNSWEQDRNTLIIWSGCLENEYKDMVCEISEPTYSLDIVPTLSNLFGLEYDSRLLVGRDVFSDDEAIVLWTNYSWVTVQGKYDSATSTYYPNEGYENDEAYVSRINRIVANRINFSAQVVDTDYYRTLFGNDNDT